MRQFRNMLIGVSPALLSDICRSKRNITDVVADRLAELAAPEFPGGKV